MTEAPFHVDDGSTFTYYQKDNTYYSFLITDDPDYAYGGVYSYFNGNVLKVRCYEQSPGVNITVRFAGNYELTKEQKDQIRFTLQKENRETGEWDFVESHYFSEFSYDSINFTASFTNGMLEDHAIYRMIEEFALPASLEGIIEENVSVSVSNQIDGIPVEENANEFLVDPYDARPTSYSFTFTNEYAEHKLMVVVLDEDTGDKLSGAVFGVYAAVPDGQSAEPLAVYTTEGKEGAFTIRRNGGEYPYAPDTLYYAVEMTPPADHILPEEAEKIYFCFSENSASLPAGLPSGATAADLW